MKTRKKRKRGREHSITQQGWLLTKEEELTHWNVSLINGTPQDSRVGVCFRLAGFRSTYQLTDGFTEMAKDIIRDGGTIERTLSMYLESQESMNKSKLEAELKCRELELEKYRLELEHKERRDKALTDVLVKLAEL